MADLDAFRDDDAIFHAQPCANERLSLSNMSLRERLPVGDEFPRRPRARVLRKDRMEAAPSRAAY